MMNMMMKKQTTTTTAMLLISGLDIGQVKQKFTPGQTKKFLVPFSYFCKYLVPIFGLLVTS